MGGTEGTSIQFNEEGRGKKIFGGLGRKLRKYLPEDLNFYVK